VGFVVPGARVVEERLNFTIGALGGFSGDLVPVEGVPTHLHYAYVIDTTANTCILSSTPARATLAGGIMLLDALGDRVPAAAGYPTQLAINAGRFNLVIPDTTLPGAVRALLVVRYSYEG
jgi:hypothetical protein